MAEDAVQFALARTKLSSSALSLDDAHKMGMRPTAPKETAAEFAGCPEPALRMAYYDLDGRERGGIVRIRRLTAGFGGAAPDPKYLQLPGTPPAAYFPLGMINGYASWRTIASDPSIALLITEGELKAACACKFGFPTIGLGGVNSYCSISRGWDLLPELEEITWTGRYVTVIFDSDAEPNKNVDQACDKLQYELAHRGALPRAVKLPAPKGAKVGLDDYLTADPARRVPELKKLIASACVYQLALQLQKLNDEFCVIGPGSFLWSLEEAHPLQRSAFQLAVENKHFKKRLPNGKVVDVDVGEEWLRSPCRRRHKAIIFDPSQPRVSAAGLNQYAGWPCEPRAGSVEPWHDLMRHLFVNAERDRAWFERWIGYKVQHPDTKLQSAIALWSSHHGTGKSLAGECITGMFGIHGHDIKPTDFESTFNGWQKYRLVVSVNELSASEANGRSDVFKQLITSKTTTINVKYEPQYAVDDRCNYILTSNREDAFPIEESDRRYFLHEVVNSPPDKAFFNEIGTWAFGKNRSTGARIGAGLPALIWYFLHLDLNGFAWNETPPMTASKLSAIDGRRSNFELWMRAFYDDPDSVMRIGLVKLTRDIGTATEALDLYRADPHRDTRLPTLAAAGRMLRFVGFPYAGLVKINGRPERLYIFRNRERWIGVSPRELAKHVINGRKKDGVIL